MRRVLHVVESLDRGAVENWLVRMLEHARGRQIEVDWSFYCTLDRPGVLEEKAQSLGAQIITSPVPIVRKVAFVRALRAQLQRGRYEVLHCHHDLVSALYLLASTGLPITRRLVHVHNADENVLTPSPMKQRLYREPLRQVCLAMADCIVGISNHTLDTFLDGRMRRPGRDLIHYYGVNPTRFESAGADRAGFRRQIGVAEDALLLLFGGRIVPEKNPLFAVEVLAKMHRREPRAIAIFAGSGSLEQAVTAYARELRVEDAVILLGWQPGLMGIMSCCDWFILPRPEHPVEGFGMAVMEAQLAGLPMLLSRGVADDPLLPTACFRRLSLSAGAEKWAEMAIELAREPRPSRADSLDALKASPMDMDYALEHLLALYT